MTGKREAARMSDEPWKLLITCVVSCQVAGECCASEFVH